MGSFMWIVEGLLGRGADWWVGAIDQRMQQTLWSSLDWLVTYMCPLEHYFSRRWVQ
jgi:hypothetical protein